MTGEGISHEEGVEDREEDVDSIKEKRTREETVARMS